VQELSEMIDWNKRFGGFHKEL